MERAGEAGKEVERLLGHAADYEQKLAKLCGEYLYNMGHSGEIGGRYILQQLKGRAAKKGQPARQKEKGEEKG